MQARSALLPFVTLLAFAAHLVLTYSMDVPETATPQPATPIDEPVRLVDPFREVAAPIGLPAERIDVSTTPRVTVRYGTSAHHQRLDLALARFREAGLALPDLEVVFAGTETSCKGHHGLFQQSHTPWRITICSDVGFVYEHELAHGWLAATMTDEQREGFMDLRGYTVWSDHDVPWNERGIEGVAFIIQQGLGGLPLPPALSDEQLSRLDAFEFLTGSPDPRLAEWEARTAQHGERRVAGH